MPQLVSRVLKNWLQTFPAIVLLLYGGVDFGVPYSAIFYGDSCPLPKVTWKILAQKPKDSRFKYSSSNPAFSGIVWVLTNFIDLLKQPVKQNLTINIVNYWPQLISPYSPFLSLPTHSHILWRKDFLGFVSRLPPSLASRERMFSPKALVPDKTTLVEFSAACWSLFQIIRHVRVGEDDLPLHKDTDPVICPYQRCSA